MSIEKLNGLYVITDNELTPTEDILDKVELALKGGATIIQLRDKKSSPEIMKQVAIYIQQLCDDFGALFVLNDDIELACELQCGGLHIGKSDHERFDEIREKFNGVIGVSCYGDVDMAKEFEQKGADYVAFGSFFTSPTKPSSNIISLDVLSKAKDSLNIPVCAIGGINTQNVDEVMKHKPDMVSLIHDIWSADDITKQSKFYKNKF